MYFRRFKLPYSFETLTGLLGKDVMMVRLIYQDIDEETALWVSCRRNSCSYSAFDFDYFIVTDRLPTPAYVCIPGGSAGKESACNVGDLGLIPVLARSPGEGKG